jgi:putative transposase
MVWPFPLSGSRREGLKVSARQQKSGWLWPSDRSCVRLRAERLNEVLSYDFVVDRTREEKKFRMLNIIDEFTHEGLAIGINRKLNAVDVRSVYPARRAGPYSF